MTPTEHLRAIAETRPRVIYASERLHRAYQRECRDNARFSDGPFRYAYVDPDGRTMPRYLCLGVEVRVRKGLRKPVAGDS